MASSSDTLSGVGSTQESLGVQVLRKIWDIPDKISESEQTPKGVSTDIYTVPATARRVPQRKHPH